ncbi:MAG: hypothetical protein GXP47_15435 [Acidobacteria bacterium]|nr:hypothetical protein [Acidobacteriota bacterium]
MLTGYNTDIDHAGTTYHVQTEDRGEGNPVIESLVYANGEILYSRRTPYAELLAQGIEEKTLASIMDRQHRTLVEVIRRGRLKDLTARAAPDDADDTAVSAEEPVSPLADGAGEAPEEKSLDEVILEYLEAQKARAHLVLRARGDEDFVYGKSARVGVVALNSNDNEPIPEVRIMVLFKSTAEPRRLVLAEGLTGPDGEFSETITLPQFNGGTSAVVVTAEADLGQSEIKHLVHR